jgi:hypothetical protein
MKAWRALAAILAVTCAACGQFSGVHHATSPRATTFTPSTEDLQLVGLIVKTTTVPGSKAKARANQGAPVRIDLLDLYQRAAVTCPGLPWTVLAAIGTVESNNGLSNAPGVHSGANFKGAEGPMQMLPATFAAYALPVPPGGADPPNPYDPVDAVYAAARDLCANGAVHGRDLPRAIFAYNHADWYVTEVLRLAARYAGTPS